MGDQPRSHVRRIVRSWTRRPGAGYATATAFVALVTLAIGLIPAAVPLGQRSSIYLVAVLGTGAVFGRGPAIAAAVLSFLAFDWFFVAPAHTLHVADPDEWQALLLFLFAAVVTGHLTALLRERVEAANRRERQAVALYQVGKALAGAAPAEAALVAAADRLRDGLALAHCDVVLPDGAQLRPLRGRPLDTSDAATARWVLEHGQAAVRGQNRGARRLVRIRQRTASAVVPGRFGGGDVGATFLPLTVEGKTVGVLHAVSAAEGKQSGLAEARVLASACDQMALAVERGRLQRETLQAEVLKRTDELRAALLSTVSHDLRTPLAAIKAAAGSLLQQDVAWDEATRLAFTTQIEREADRLNRLVDNLLDLSRIEAGALVLDRQWYPLAELVADTLGRLAGALARHRVETVIPDSLPPVCLDYVLIQQVLANLLENAAKFSPTGACIRISAATAGDSVRVRVEDEGPGLPPTERDRVFERFYRVTQPRPRPVAAADQGGAAAGARGTGLGLAVCAGFVAAHGGRIWVEPTSGAAAPGAPVGQAGPAGASEEPERRGGAAFVFELPMLAPPAPSQSQATPAARDTPGASAARDGAAWAQPGHAAEVYRRRRRRTPQAQRQATEV
jgi:two-component system sensor histidine kinase KdpD